MLKHKAFTLIELLVVIGITLLLVFGVVTGLSAGRESREVKTTAERVRAMILEARSRAMNPEDTALGLEQVEVRINEAQPNKVKIVEVYPNAPASEKEKIIQEYMPPQVVKIEPFGGKTGELLYNNTNPANSYYYFSFDASDALTLGQASFRTTAIPPATIIILGGTNVYELSVYRIGGNVDIVAQ